jgi:hypothetical protein
LLLACMAAAHFWWPLGPRPLSVGNLYCSAALCSQHAQCAQAEGPPLPTPLNMLNAADNGGGTTTKGEPGMQGPTGPTGPAGAPRTSSRTPACRPVCAAAQARGQPRACVSPRLTCLRLHPCLSARRTHPAPAPNPAPLRTPSTAPRSGHLADRPQSQRYRHHLLHRRRVERRRRCHHTVRAGCC